MGECEYLVLEIQKQESGEIGNILHSYHTRREGESAYYATLSTAAISNLPRHTVYLLTDDGQTLQSKCYERDLIPLNS